MGIKWSEMCEPNDVCYYNHFKAETPLGLLTIEWKGWDASYTPVLLLDGVYVDSTISLCDLMDTAEKYVINKLKALAASQGFAVTPKTVEFDGPLNEAGWQLISLLQEQGEVSAGQFNSIKIILKEVIQLYLDKSDKE